MHDGDIANKTFISNREDPRLQECYQPRVYANADQQGKKFPERIRFMKTEYERKPFFGIVIDHAGGLTKDIIIGVLQERLSLSAN
jgi:hypothetical protein